jgi:hypothetical protein
MMNSDLNRVEYAMPHLRGILSHVVFIDPAYSKPRSRKVVIVSGGNDITLGYRVGTVWFNEINDQPLDFVVTRWSTIYKKSKQMTPKKIINSLKKYFPSTREY